MSPRTPARPTSRPSSFYATVHLLFATPVALPSPEDEKPLETELVDLSYLRHRRSGSNSSSISEGSVDAFDVVLPPQSHQPSSSRAYGQHAAVRS
ncbi:hypothetical protein PENSPDRAFT_680389 [Peniophora sp. CONT]|nr:hypothetical protein PENSPDRAFT_680389 [Peniophora sp. CONT]